MSLVEEIKGIFNKKKEVYSLSYHEMLGDYKREQETIGGYNGRQILELIQNCDDECADLVKVKFDIENSIVSISNTGNPFSLEGYRSLSISNLSSKTSKRIYIGNKGLGFRSIINWSNVIKVYSNNICLEFSSDSKEETFNALFEGRQKMLRDEIGVDESVIPIPFLSAPRISEIESTNEFSTTIEIQYKEEFYSDIINQLKAVSSETLLFLKHIKEIQFEGINGIPNIRCEKHQHKDYTTSSFSPNEKITINDSSWSIFSKEEDLEFGDEGQKEKAFYQLKIAVKEDLSDRNAFLYSYFPTKIKMDFPYIIHGTFDLDQNRNHLNNTTKNRVVLKKLVELLVDVAKYLSSKRVSWDPYKILSIKRKDSERLKELGFYRALEMAISRERIFPCVDGHYRVKSEARQLDDHFSNIVLNNNWNTVFPLLLIPRETVDIYDVNITKGYPNHVELVDHIGIRITDMRVRAEWIKVISSNFPDSKFDMFVDQNGNLIDKAIDVYTPPSRNSEIKIPSYCNIKFVHEELYYYLLNQLNITTANDKPREFQRRLKGNGKVHSYEPAPLINKIISNTNLELKNLEEHSKADVIREMTKAIFHNFKLRKKQDVALEVASVPLLDQDLKVCSARELFLSEEFPLGKVASDIFSNVQLERKKMAKVEEYGLENEELEELEVFFTWLGVRKFASYSRLNKKKASDKYITEYCQALRKFGPNAAEVKYTCLENLQKILTEISVEEFIVWYTQDEELQICLNPRSHHDQIRKYNHTYFNKASFSFISFMVRKILGDFSNHLLDDTLHWLNSIDIEYHHPLFIQYNLNKREVDNVLAELEAKDEFEDVSIEFVSECLNLVPNRFPNGKNSQSLYKKAVNHFEKNERSLPEHMDLFADNGVGLALYPPDAIYFSDKFKIPNKLKKHYPTLNFPQRSGGAKAIQFFGINDASELVFELARVSLSDDHTKALNQFIEDIKVYLLVYRFGHLTKSSIKKQEASIIQKLDIHLCTELTYTINKQSFDTEVYEFIVQEDYQYYVKITGNESLDELRRNSKFSDCFTDIVCHAFDFKKSRVEFRNVFRGDLEDTNHSIISQHGEESVLEAMEMLGKGEYDYSFWFEISKLLKTPLRSETEVKEFVNEKEKELSLDLKRLTSKKKYILYRSKLIDQLFENLNITIDIFNEMSDYNIDSFKYHYTGLKQYFENYENKVSSSIWLYLKYETEQQDQFLDIIHSFNQFEQFIRTVSEENKYKSALNYQIILEEYLKEVLPYITIREESVNLNEIQSQLKKLFTEDELDLVQESKKLRSWLYFEDKVEKIKSELKKSEAVEVETEEAIVPSVEVSVKEPKEYTIKAKRPTPTKKQGPYIPRHEKSNRAKKRIGNTSEELVYNELVNLYGAENVTHVSKVNEGAHYDIRYKNPETEENKYVEVKTAPGNSFHLSAHEKEFGEAHQENYEIWLVKGSEIIPLKDFFKNKTFVLTPKEYLVTVELSFY